MNTATPREQALLAQAINKINELTDLGLHQLGREIPVQAGPVDANPQRLDALVTFLAGNRGVQYAAAIKAPLTRANLGLAIEQLKAWCTAVPQHKPLLITDYVNPDLAADLQAKDIAFIDTVGNAYLNEKPVYIYIRGNKPEQPARTQGRRPTRAFQTTGLKVIFGLLCKPQLLQAPYREIARATQVALGTVGWVLTDLRGTGFLLQRKDHPDQLLKKRQLLDLWTTAYHDKLRPKLVRTDRYQDADPNWWQTVDIQKYGCFWGGEVAATKLTDFLQNPETITIYGDILPATLITDRKWRPNPAGNIEIVQRFWNPDLFPAEPAMTVWPGDVVHPLLIWADLIGTADDRNLEAAKLIFDEHLAGLIGQN